MQNRAAQQVAAQRTSYTGFACLPQEFYSEKRKMELTISEKQARALIKEVLIELMEEKRDLFFEMMLEAIEEIGLANAIREGRQGEFVSEEQILATLRG